MTDAGECGTKSANAIRAGSVAPEVPHSFGEVESLNPPDNVDSYPAEGFFNLFVEVDVDLNNDGTIDATLFNNYPIVIQNSYEDTFPTDVVYVHDSNDFAVPVYEKVSQTHIGWIIIVGQDIGSGCDDNKIEEGIFDKTPLSVELTSFTAKENEENISLEWKTITEIDCKGYHLWRARKTEAGEYTEITRLTEQLIPSEGEIFGDATYYYEDFGVIPGNNYFYGLEDIANGISTIHLESIISTTGGQTCITINETLNEYPDEDFESAFVLLRLYELENLAQEVVYEITKATNRQNLVDLRDLRANDKIQRQLEIAVQELGYQYKRKRNAINNGSSTIIPSTIAAKAILAIWRRKPHLIQFREREIFGQFYEDIFSNHLNAAQLIIAVLILRMVDKERKHHSQDGNAPAFLPYASYFLAMLIGEALLKQQEITLNKLDHCCFEQTKTLFENSHQVLYQQAIDKLEIAIHKIYGGQNISLQRLSATFRRGDLLEIFN